MGFKMTFAIKPFGTESFLTYSILHKIKIKFLKIGARRKTGTRGFSFLAVALTPRSAVLGCYTRVVDLFNVKT